MPLYSLPQQAHPLAPCAPGRQAPPGALLPMQRRIPALPGLRRGPSLARQRCVLLRAGPGELPDRKPPQPQGGTRNSYLMRGLVAAGLGVSTVGGRVAPLPSPARSIQGAA